MLHVGVEVKYCGAIACGCLFTVLTENLASLEEDGGLAHCCNAHALAYHITILEYKRSSLVARAF